MKKNSIRFLESFNICLYNRTNRICSIFFIIINNLVFSTSQIINTLLKVFLMLQTKFKKTFNN